ncbi:MAG: site-specific integrase [Sphingomonas sp.]
MSFIQIREWQPFDERGRKYLNREETRRFLLAADRLAPRSRALCYVLAYTGCRVSEALHLSRRNLDAGNGALVFRTLKRRGVTYRAVPIPERLAAMLLALSAPEGGRLWTMHRATAWRHVSRAMALADVRGPMACCKGLRHGFGIRAASASIPANLIQRWMGHASGETTAIYLDAVGAEERGFARRLW